MSSSVAWILLGVCCVYDLVYKRIPLLLIIIGAVIGGILTWREGAMLFEVAWALFPGSVMLLASFFTKEKVGYGDGALLMALGLLVGGDVCLWEMEVGLLLLTFLGVVLLLIKKADGKTMVPFVPFLFVAHILHFALQI